MAKSNLCSLLFSSAAVFAVAVAAVTSLLPGVDAQKYTYSINVSRIGSESRNHPTDLFAHGRSSSFKWAYNPAYVNVYSSSAGADVPCLLVRAQNPAVEDTALAANPNNPGESVLAASCAGSDKDLVTNFAPLTDDSVVVENNGSAAEKLGTEDPRLVRIDGTFYLFYTAVSQLNSTTAVARLSLAVCSSETAKADWVSQHGEESDAPKFDELTACFTGRDAGDIQRSWVRRGHLLPDDEHGFQFTKSGALLLRNEENDPAKPPTPGGSLLIFGDCSQHPGLQMMTLNSWESYNLLPGYLMEKRPGNFDSGLIESGPPPMRLATGDYLFLYNAAQNLYGLNNQMFYNPGFVILNGSNPQQVLQRSDAPIMWPQYVGETSGLVPYVVFFEGMEYAPGTQHLTNQTSFIVYYGAADSTVEATEMVVTWSRDEVKLI